MLVQVFAYIEFSLIPFLGPNKHQSAVTCLQFDSKFVVTSSDDGTVKLWDVKTGMLLPLLFVGEHDYES